ncbi:MAG: AI-2E family transporter YdiK [Steroidobacteraceae bacterium]
MLRATPHEIARPTFTVLIIGLLLVGSLWTLLPFIGALIWAAAIVVASWPLLLWVQRLAGERRAVAVTVMTLIVLVLVIVPFWVAVNALLDASRQGIELLRSFLAHGLGPPPAWISDIPYLGERITRKWSELAAAGQDEFAATVRPYARSAAHWMLAITGGIGGLLVHFLLTVILVGVLYAQGETAAQGLIAFARRLGGERAAGTVILAGQSVRSVALGVVVTALLQTSLAGLGLWVTGVPHPGLLTAIVFVFCIAQVGPILVLVPAVIWMYANADPLWATALLIWSIPVLIMDNFLRPILISRGVDLPLLLIFAGVIGGLIGFGVIGLFVGPVVLAVTYTSLVQWVRDDTTTVPAIPGA